MGYIKLGAFMILCNKCSTGTSVSDEDYKKEIITCFKPDCGNQFTIYEGIKNGLKKVEDHITPNNFLANDMYHGVIEVKIGYTTHVELPENTKKIYNIKLLPNGPFLAGAVNVTKNGFDIFTSLPTDSDSSLAGESATVVIIVNFKVEDYEVPWLHMLQYSLDQLRSSEFLTSILLSEIALETYIDSILTVGYSEIGLDKDSISRLLTATEIPVKVNPLMNNLFNVKLASSSSWREWEKKVLKWRNEIAHGTKVNATKEEAILAYEVVIDSIFHFIEAVDNHLKQKGYTDGLFYRGS